MKNQKSKINNNNNFQTHLEIKTKYKINNNKEPPNSIKKNISEIGINFDLIIIILINLTFNMYSIENVYIYIINIKLNANYV